MNEGERHLGEHPEHASAIEQHRAAAEPVLTRCDELIARVPEVSDDDRCAMVLGLPLTPEGEATRAEWLASMGAPTEGGPADVSGAEDQPATALPLPATRSAAPATAETGAIDRTATREPVTTDPPAQYDEQRSTIDVSARPAPDTAEANDPDGLPAAEYDEGRDGQTIDIGPAAAEPEPATGGGRRKRRAAASRDRDGAPSGGANAHITSDPTGGRLRANISERLSVVERHLGALPSMAVSFSEARDQLSADAAFVTGAEIAQLVARVEDEILALQGDLEVAREAGVGDPAADATSRASENQANQTRHAAVVVGFDGIKAQLAGLISPITFRSRPVAGAVAGAPPARDFGRFLHREIGRTTMLIATIEDLLGRLATSADGELPRDVIDLVEQWQSDRGGFLFVTHALRTLGHTRVLDATTRDGKSVAARAEQISRAVPQTTEDIVAALERAASHASSGDRDAASQLVELALERMSELGNQLKIRAAVQAVGGAGAAARLAETSANEAETRVVGLRNAVARASASVTSGAVELGAMWNEAIAAVNVAAPAYKMVTGEMGLADSPYATADAWSAISQRSIVGIGAAVMSGGALAEFGLAGVYTGAVRLAQTGKAAWASVVAWAGTNPDVAAEVAQFAAAMGLQLGEGGVQGFLQQLNSPEGIVSLLADFLSIRQAGMGGASPDAPAPKKEPSGAGNLKAQALDFLDQVGARKDALLAWADGELPKADAVAVADNGGSAKVPSTADNFDTKIAESLQERRGKRAGGGYRSYEPTPGQRYAAYHPPSPDASVVDIARQLASEARNYAPHRGAKTDSERAAAYKKQVSYFDRVEEQARQEKSRIEERRKNAQTDEEQAALDAEYSAAERVEAAATIKSIGGALPINAQFAGNVFPASRLPKAIRDKYPDGVRFTADGFPDFEPYAKVVVTVDGLIGDTYRDFSAANLKAGFPDDPKGRSPAGWTWHHHQDGKRMVLVPRALHTAVKHTGGAAIIRARAGDEDPVENEAENEVEVHSAENGEP